MNEHIYVYNDSEVPRKKNQVKWARAWKELMGPWPDAGVAYLERRGG